MQAAYNPRARQTHLRRNLPLPTNRSLQLRRLGVPNRGNLHAVASGLQLRVRAGAGDVPNVEHHDAEQLQLGQLWGMVSDEGFRILSPDSCYRPPKRHGRCFRGLLFGEHRRVSSPGLHQDG